MKTSSIFVLALLLLTSCTNSKLDAPIARKIQKELNIHEDTRIDNYFWMRLSDEQKKAETPDKQTQDVLSYLNAENNYQKSVMKDTEGLQEELYDEIVGRIKQDDQSVPVSVNGYTYYERFEEGQDYPLYCRKENIEGATEEIMLNTPEMAKDKSYFAIGERVVSENNKLLAFSVDTISRREYIIRIKDLETGKILDDKIDITGGGIIWANDNRTIFYSKNNPVTLRSNQIYKHVIGTDVSNDILVYEEKDETFSCYISKTKSRKYLMIGSYQTLSTEFRYLDANTPNGKWKIIQPRERDLEYHVKHFGDYFYILTNYKAKNFRLVKTPIDKTKKENWLNVIDHKDDVLLEGLDIFKDYMVVQERIRGLPQLKVINWDNKSEHYIALDDPAYSIYPFDNPKFDSNFIRFYYSSLTTPTRVYDYDFSSKEKRIMKQQEVLGGNFDSKNYTSERIFARSRDGETQIPISIVYRKGFAKNGKSPLLLYGYGSYGNNVDPLFRSNLLSLLDRGFVYAIAHIRGGQVMGRYWYEDGKLLKKKNTFYDFIDCGKYLVEENYCSKKHLYAEGASAGGLLMGAVINMEPKLWNGAIAQVPFVDVVSTMLDESIPLTTSEFDEWGNPKTENYYNYIKSYSPYDNVEKKEYPNILVTTGYWDSQVQYWEPAKWVAKLRDNKTNDNLLIMNCNMDVGHSGASGRFKKYKNIALKYAFLLKLEGID